MARRHKVADPVVEELRALRQDVRNIQPAALLLVDEAVKLGWKRGLIRRLIASKEIAVVRDGPTGHPRIPVTELTRWLEENRHRQPAPRPPRRRPGRPKTPAAQAAELRKQLRAEYRRHTAR